jgi:hypothetical protein
MDTFKVSSRKRAQSDMQVALQVTKKLTVTPLIDIQHSAFADTYSKGLWWAMHGDYQGEKPLPDSYLIDNLERDASRGFFDGQHDDSLDHLGFYFGMVHGGILVPRTGQLRPNVTALITFSQQDTARGYMVARRSCFYDREPASNIDTDIDLLDVLCSIAEERGTSPTMPPRTGTTALGVSWGALVCRCFPRQARNGGNGKQNTAHGKRN